MRTVDRRTVLRGLGAAVATAFVRPARLAAAPPPVGPVMTTLSEYMSAARGRRLPPEVVEKCTHHILDTFAAMVSGTELAPGRVALAFAKTYRNTEATVAGSQLLCGPIEAAFVNAMLAHADETDDSHAPSQSHPGCAVVPAALATGEQFGLDGATLIRAVTLGYDVGTRVTMTVGVPGFETRTHVSTHALASLFGAAAAAACAAGLTAQQMRWVLDYAVQQASGSKLWQRDTDHVEKAFVFAASGARGGVMAAELVRLGATGVDDVLSGENNFVAALAPDARPETLVERLGERYEVVRTNIKRWTVGSPIQAPLDALELIFRKRAFDADAVAQVTVRCATSEAALVDNRDMPDICMQHMIAVMLVDRTASFRAAHDKPRMQDPAILRQRAKVRLVRDEELERHLPRREAIVEVRLADGTTLTERVDAVRGTAENPMPRAEVVAKCQDLMAPVLGADRTATLVDRVLNLDTVADVRTLRPLLQRPS
ncbi:MAG TPA: MmgE/PrpD family protein [Vicinamibacterales bacterium]|nr:MmgE/PrpD family protein [Vicinamibacterales bacterium]